jgi:hypothetical protein
MNQHKLVIDRSVIEYDYNSTKTLPPEQAFKYQLFYQMSRLTRDKGSLGHDDRLDCLSIAVAYWVESMAQDAQKRIISRREELLEQELKLWDNDGKMSVGRLMVASGLNGLPDFGLSFTGYSTPAKESHRSNFNRGSTGRAGGLLSRY